MKKILYIVTIVVFTFILFFPCVSQGQIFKISDEAELIVDIAISANLLYLDTRILTEEEVQAGEGPYDISFGPRPNIGIGLHVVSSYNNFTYIGLNFFPSVTTHSTNIEGTLTKFTSINFLFAIQLLEFGSVGYGIRMLVSSEADTKFIPSIVFGASISLGFLRNFLL